MSGAAARPAYDGIMARVVCPEGVTFEEGVVGTVPGWWVRPANAQPDVALVHFHGGWFNFGSAFAFQNLVAHIAVAAGAAAFVPEYRLAPENPFPAAPDDALACYIGLVGLGFRRIALVGDSAGGALALVTLATAHALAGVPEPVAAVALSPVTDLTFAGESWTTKSDVDPYFTLPQVHVQADGYLAGHDPLDPRASPLFGDLSGLPPIRIHVGTEEMLFDDSNRYAERAGEAGVEVELHVWEGMPHGFLSGAGRLAAAAGALDSIGHFLRDCLTA
ncbi:esterase [Novosphingobium sp. Fuku2-ISO-50]|nr:esterase [Novosphingobium sp. Fuku2-ISO-50]